MSETVKPLPDRLEGAASDGHDEWRVQDPKDGAYCIAYSWPDVANPEREARDWLADQQTRFPKGRYASYEVACVRVVPHKDRLLAEAAAALRDVSMMLGMCAHRLRRNGHADLSDKAVDLLRRKGLLGSPLREVAQDSHTPEATAGNAQ
jgi:hypothetical protein